MPGHSWYGKNVADARRLSIALHFSGTASNKHNIVDRILAIKYMLADPECDQADAANLLGITQGSVSQLNNLAASLAPKCLDALRVGKIKKTQHAFVLAKMVTGGEPDVVLQEAKLAEMLAKPAADSDGIAADGD